MCLNRVATNSRLSMSRYILLVFLYFLFLIILLAWDLLATNIINFMFQQVPSGRPKGRFLHPIFVPILGDYFGLSVVP